MEQLTNLFAAFGEMASSPSVLLCILIGIVGGTMLGAIPGLSSTVGLTLVIPFSYYLSPLEAVAMMYAIHKCGTYGGSITAILLNTPGTPAAACTQLDGYPLTRQGKAGKALKTAVIASGIGDIFSDFVLIFGSVYAAELVWHFGPVEMTAILFFAFALISTVTGSSPLKGVVSVCAGLILSFVGMDPVNLAKRFTFGVYQLNGGLNLIPVLTGLFILSEVLIQSERRADFSSEAKQARDNLGQNQSVKHEDNILTMKEFKSILPAISLSSIIGTVIGILPGLGAAVAPFISYGQAKSISRHPEQFGKGSLEGIAAAESSNNAVCGANLIPLFSLGIPGSTDAALMMSVFMINGIEFGPRLMESNASLVYGIFAAGLLSIAGYLCIGLTCSRQIGMYVTRIPPTLLYPAILFVVFVGTYSDSNNPFDLIVLVVFGMLGYILKKFAFPIPPMIIAFMLGLKFETALRQSLVMSDHGFLIFLSSPVSAVLVVLGFAVFFYNIYVSLRHRRTAELACGVEE